MRQRFQREIDDPQHAEGIGRDVYIRYGTDRCTACYTIAPAHNPIYEDLYFFKKNLVPGVVIKVVVALVDRGSALF